MEKYIEIFRKEEKIENTKWKEEWKNFIETSRFSLGGRAEALEAPHSNSITKICIANITPKTTPKEIYTIGGKYSLIEVFIENNELLERCAGWKINSVLLDLASNSLGLRKGTISKVTNQQMYFTIDMSLYYKPNTKRAWISNVRDLLRLTNKKHITISAGAMDITEEEIVEVFKQFGIKRKTALSFLTENPKQMLIRASVKRYVYNGIFVQMQEQEPKLKKMAYKSTKPLSYTK